MSGKPGLKTELVNGLLEARSILDNFIKAVSDILDFIEKNESLDHKNDKTRRQTMGFLLDASQQLNLNNYSDVGKNLHAAMQRLHSQEIEDLEDDRPRGEAKIKISVFQEKANNSVQRLCILAKKVEGEKSI